MATVQIETGDGSGQIEVENVTKDELKLFEKEYPVITRLYSQYLPGSVIDSYMNTDYVKKSALVALANAKNDLQPTGGTFRGVYAKSGFGWSPIRADYLVPTAQARTFETALSGLTAQSYYGLWHNGAIGAAYNATALYLRKEVAVLIVGLMELTGNPLAEAIQIELNSQPLPIQLLNWHTLGGDKPVYWFPTPIYIKPAGVYRSRFQSAVVAGTFNLQPIGIAFPTSEYMLNTAPTEPSTTSP